MRSACDSDSRCGLACDASARDAKSLAMWVERCEPLSHCVCEMFFEELFSEELREIVAIDYFFLRIIFVRLRELVVALCFLAVSIDALAKQLSILEADYTTLETLQNTGRFEDDCAETLQNLVFQEKCTKSAAKAGILEENVKKQCRLFAVGLEHEFTGWKCCKS